MLELRPAATSQKAVQLQLPQSSLEMLTGIKRY